MAEATITRRGKFVVNSWFDDNLQKMLFGYGLCQNLISLVGKTDET